MTLVAEVKLWGRTIGAVSLIEDTDTAAFQYESDFVKSGIEISPLVMPLSDKVYSFPNLSNETFHGLPGLLADSLPDRFGNALINAWLASQGRRSESFSTIERLCYIGQRGMGALEFTPAIGPSQVVSNIEIDTLVELASEVLSSKNNLKTSLSGIKREKALRNILQVGTSAGGARAKAVIAWNPKTNEVRSGQLPAGKGFEHWLLKFDGVSGNKDKELNDPKGYGLIEYAYSKIAVAAGINMTKCRIFSENGRNHFMTRRFDRKANGEKIHKQSLCAMAHYDFNMAGAYSYEQALMVIRQLGLPMRSIEEMFRRMAFNIIGRNQDDHVKNIAFLMDKAGTWSLAPAFDLIYSYNPSGEWTSSHQMTLNGKRDNFSLEDFKACAKTASMKRGRTEAIVKEVHKAFLQWRDYADEVGVSSSWRDQIYENLRLENLI